MINPKAIWNLLKVERKPPSTGIKPDDWFKYFSDLLNPQLVNENYLEDGEAHLIENEYLDRPITESEVLQAIKKS